MSQRQLKPDKKEYILFNLYKVQKQANLSWVLFQEAYPYLESWLKGGTMDLRFMFYFLIWVLFTWTYSPCANSLNCSLWFAYFSECMLPISIIFMSTKNAYGQKSLWAEVILPGYIHKVRREKWQSAGEHRNCTHTFLFLSPFSSAPLPASPLKALHKVRIMQRIKFLLENRIALVALLHRDCFQGDIWNEFILRFLEKLRSWRKKNYCHEKDYLEAGDGGKCRTVTFF